MSDLGDDEMVPERGHRCRPGTPGRAPMIGERAACSCGREFVWTQGRFLQWLPVEPAGVPTPSRRATRRAGAAARALRRQ